MKQALAVTVCLVGLLLVGCSTQPGKASSVSKPEPLSLAATATPAKPSASASTASAPTQPKLDVKDLGSSKDKWRRAAISVSVRGDSLVVEVQREVTSAEMDSIANASTKLRDELGLQVVRVSVVYRNERDSNASENGYMLGYRSLE